MEQLLMTPAPSEDSGHF
jgi:hypothetical protein